MSFVVASADGYALGFRGRPVDGIRGFRICICINISRCVLGVFGSGRVLNVTGVGQGWG